MPHVHNPDRQRPGFTLGILSLSALSYILLQSMVIPALPQIGRALHTSQSTVTWVLTAYLLSASVATPVLGRLGDMFGKRVVLVGVLVSLVVGSLIAALTNDVTVMIVARIIQGGGGAIFPLAFSIIRDEFPRERVAGAIGLISAFIGIGAGVAIAIAGPIAQHLSIHWLFWIPGAMAIVATIATIAYVPESPIKTPGRIDPLAVLTLSGWLVALLLPASEGQDWGWSSTRVIGLFALGVVLFAAWVVVEQRSRQPLVDVRMMRVPAVWWTNVSATLFGFGMYSVMVAIPAYLQTPRSLGYGFGSSITQSGLVLLPMSGAMLVAGLITGPLTARMGSKVPLVVGSLLSAAGMLPLAVWHGAQWEFYAAMTVVGLGIGFAFSAMSNLVVEAVPAHQTGIATGMNANVRTIGGALGSAVVAALIVSGVPRGAAPHAHGYVLAFWVMGAGLLAAGLAALLVPSLERRRAASSSTMAAAAAEAREFDGLGSDPIGTEQAGLAIGERIGHH